MNIKSVGFTSALFLICLAGCNQSPYELAPARGSITVDGKPLTSGQVMFAPRATGDSAEPGKPAIGWLDANGTFELSTYSEGDGAVVGEHMVTLFGPADKSELPAGIPPFKRIAVRGDALVVQPQTDNQFDIDIPKEDLEPMKYRGRTIKQ